MTQPRHASSASVRRRDLRKPDARRTPAASRAPEAATAGTYTTPRHAGTQGRHRLRGIAVTLVGLLAFSGTAVAAAYSQLQGDVSTVDVGGLIDPPTDADGSTAPPADPNAGTALNILIVGSDSRADGAVGHDVDSVLADTHIVAHISADRTRVELVSIPRDTMVDIPGCRTSSGDTIAPWFGQYNEAFAIGWQRGGDTATALACDINLAQSVTGLTIDGFVLVEMGGFINMVDALGGVDICLDEPIYAPKANLDLPAGQQTLDGEQALGYARARTGQGLSGSDPDRIERQQHLMSAMVDEVLSRNVLTDGPALYKMLRAALGSLTMSENLGSLNNMAGLALSLRSLDLADVTFMTTPFAAYAPNPNRLVFTSEVDVIWERMAADEPIVQTEPEVPEDPTGEASTAVDPGNSTTDEPTTDEPTTEPADQATTDDSGASTADDLTPVC